MNRDMSLEYVLGALSEAEIKDFEKKICTDARLYQSTVEWNNHLLTLVDATPIIKNPIKFQEIERELFSKNSNKRIFIILIITAVIFAKIAFGTSMLF